MLHVTEWDKTYENAGSRKLKRLAAVQVPNRYDGSRYAALVTGANGAQRYAAWVILLGIASQGGPGERGYIRRSDGTPHTPQTLSLVTRLDTAIFEDAIPALLELGWLEQVEVSKAAEDEPDPDFS